MRNALSLDDEGGCRDKTKRPDQKTERTNGKQKSKREQSTPKRKSTRKKAEKLDGLVLMMRRKRKKKKAR